MTIKGCEVRPVLASSLKKILPFPVPFKQQEAAIFLFFSYLLRLYFFVRFNYPDTVCCISSKKYWPRGIRTDLSHQNVALAKRQVTELKNRISKTGISGSENVKAYFKFVKAYFKFVKAYGSKRQGVFGRTNIDD